MERKPRACRRQPWFPRSARASQSVVYHRYRSSFIGVFIVIVHRSLVLFVHRYRSSFIGVGHRYRSSLLFTVVHRRLLLCCGYHACSLVMSERREWYPPPISPRCVAPIRPMGTTYVCVVGWDVCCPSFCAASPLAGGFSIRGLLYSTSMVGAIGVGSRLDTLAFFCLSRCGIRLSSNLIDAGCTWRQRTPATWQFIVPRS